jgi:sugar phosphate isomerase/epimerase
MRKPEESISRRGFLGSATMVAAGMAAGARPAATPANIKVGLYSITFLGAWYRGEALTLEQVIQRAKQYGYDGIEIDGKRPHGNPLDMPKSSCLQLRKQARDNGVEICAVAANNDFSSPIPEHREAQLVYMRELSRMTADLGVKTLRVFLAWPGVTTHPQIARYDIARPLWQEAHKQFSAEQTWNWCRQGLLESARYAGEFGVTLALQNHAPVIDDDRDVLRMVREVASPYLKVCLDAPLLRRKDEASIRKIAADVGALQVLSHFGGEYEQSAGGTIKGEEFYPPFIRAMLEIGYNGYIDYELCHPLPVVDGKTVGIEFAEKNARLAAEYMRGVIAAARKRA